MFRLFCYYLTFVCCTFSYGQQEVSLYFHADKQTVKKKTDRDSTGYEDEKLEAIQLLKLNGFVGLKLRDSSYKGNRIHFYFDFDHHFKKIETVCQNCPKHAENTDRSFGNAAMYLDRKITDLENNGFPFSSIKVLSQEEDDKVLFITYLIDSGYYFFIDKIHIKSEDKVHEKTFLTMINLKEGDTYDESKIRSIKRLLEASPFYGLKRDAEVLFKKGKAEVFLYVEKKKSSNADGFVGFNQDPDTKKLVFNGNINLSLKNALNRAEVLDLAWKSNPDKTQNLKGELKYPYIFGSPVGIGSRIDLRKQDTSFIQSNIWIEASYLHPRFTFTIFDQIEGSSTISSSVPEDFRDYKKNTIGLQAEFRPRMPDALSFYHPQLSVTGGIFNYRSDTIDDNKQKIGNNKYGFGYGHTIDFLKYFHLNNRLSFQGLSSSIPLSRNELIYYGGLRSVRGFYELELFGNNVWIVNNEIEFRPIKSISMALIYDYSIADYEGKRYTNSVGIGFGFLTGNIALEIALANGKINENSFDFSNSRIHIGFRSSF